MIYMRKFNERLLDIEFQLIVYRKMVEHIDSYSIANDAVICKQFIERLKQTGGVREHSSRNFANKILYKFAA
jgi:hypothetical protein